ncbi:MAG TPA: metal-sensitive transcriptional regulator [Candidatus Ozemobacteraceae bacterium]|nr:metal-sensitive transcriptional regulator [Candidatus Ozemobacteraceae bacterium]HQG27546.1 metal-sensitive transcriptional regulator [Candidatus Ozemobacteraceae bacterium]
MNEHDDHHHHESHPDVDRRLARIAGHIEGIRRMIGEEKPCTQILQQMKAVISALESARRIVLTDHVRHCLAHAIQKKSSKAAVDEVEQILSQLL